MTLKLEVGRRYVDREGNRVTITTRMDHPTHPFYGSDFCRYREDGGWGWEIDGKYEPELSDLIALAPDEAPQPQQPDELATLRERVRELEAEGDRLRDCYKTEVLKAQEYLRMNDTLRAENARLREALDSIEVYGSDTLSGRVTPDAATYKDWLIDGIRVMRDRARAALAQTEAENG